MPAYRFKAIEECVWFVLTTVGFQVAQYLMTFDPDRISDPRAWAISFGGAIVRFAAGAVMDWRNRPRPAGSLPERAS